MQQEAQAPRLLNVGDKILKSHYSKESIVAIDRVTPSQAFIGHTKFKRELQVSYFGAYLKEIGAQRFGNTSYWVATPEMIERIEKAEKLQKAKAEIETKLKTVTLEQAVKILEILNA